MAEIVICNQGEEEPYCIVEAYDGYGKLETMRVVAGYDWKIAEQIVETWKDTIGETAEIVSLNGECLGIKISDDHFMTNRVVVHIREFDVNRLIGQDWSVAADYKSSYFNGWKSNNE